MDTTILTAWLLYIKISFYYQYLSKGLHGVTDLHRNVLSLHHLYHLSSEPGWCHPGQSLAIARYLMCISYKLQLYITDTHDWQTYTHMVFGNLLKQCGSLLHWQYVSKIVYCFLFMVEKFYDSLTSVTFFCNVITAHTSTCTYKFKGYCLEISVSLMHDHDYTSIAVFKVWTVNGNC